VCAGAPLWWKYSMADEMRVGGFQGHCYGYRDKCHLHCTHQTNELEPFGF
jgi:hypothetical protein